MKSATATDDAKDAKTVFAESCSRCALCVWEPDASCRCGTTCRAVAEDRWSRELYFRPPAERTKDTGRAKEREPIRQRFQKLCAGQALA